MKWLTEKISFAPLFIYGIIFSQKEYINAKKESPDTCPPWGIFIYQNIAAFQNHFNEVKDRYKEIWIISGLIFWGYIISIVVKCLS